jgi:hypothetical protein
MEQDHGEQQGNIQGREDSQHTPKVKAAQTDAPVTSEFQTKQRSNQETAEQKENRDAKATGDDDLAETGVSEENKKE